MGIDGLKALQGLINRLNQRDSYLQQRIGTTIAQTTNDGVPKSSMSEVLPGPMLWMSTPGGASAREKALFELENQILVDKIRALHYETFRILKGV